MSDSALVFQHAQLELVVGLVILLILVGYILSRPAILKRIGVLIVVGIGALSGLIAILHEFGYHLADH